MPTPLFRFAGRALDGYRLLVAEDDALTAESICMTIRDAGGEVVGPAAGVEEATRLAACEPIDGAIVDMALADGPATALLDLLASEAVPVVLATAASLDAIPRAYWRMMRLAKPYDARTLVECALAALGDRSPPLQMSPASGLDGSA